MFHQEQKENISCPYFCKGNLETGGGLCLTGSLPGVRASSSSGVSTFLRSPFLSSIFDSFMLFCFIHFSHHPPVLFPVAPGTCIPCHFCLHFAPFHLHSHFDAQASWRLAPSPMAVWVLFPAQVGLLCLPARHCSIKGQAQLLQW